MKCMLCAKETNILTENQVCSDCEIEYFGTNKAEPEFMAQDKPKLTDQDKPKLTDRDKPELMPQTILGTISAILTLLTAVIFLFLIATAKVALFLTLGISIFTVIPALISIILSLIAIKGLDDHSRIVKIALIVGIALALLAVPISIYVSSLLPPGSLFEHWLKNAYAINS